MPIVSVIIPAYNAERFIEQTIRSVLSQTYQDFEIIVVDDGSTDQTRQVLEPFMDRVVYIYQGNQKQAAARNAGVQISRGEYIAFLDSDDLWFPSTLATLTQRLATQSDAGLVASGFEYIDEQSHRLGVARPWLAYPIIDLRMILYGGLTPPSAVLLRRRWIDRVGGFDPTLAPAEDMDLWFRLAVSGCRMDWAQAILCQYRVHTANVSRNPKAHYAALYRALDKLFARRDLPEWTYKEKSGLYAQIRLAEAGRQFGAGNSQEAKEAVQTATMMDPSLLGSEDRRLANAVVDWHKNVWNTRPEVFLDEVLENLPENVEVPRNLAKQIRLNIDKARFYDAFDTRSAQTVRQLWGAIACHDLAWLLDRGGWSILWQSFGWLKKNPTSR
jgi:glycosyltransferase involved in cell wall biosynthesis